MVLDGTYMASDSRMLTNREAALLKGQWWECADDGSQVWQRLSIKPSLPTITRHATEELAIIRAVRDLKRRRVELLMELERLKGRFDAVSAMPMARLLARKELATLTAQIEEQRKRLTALPQKPTVVRLDPDASCGVPADATTKSIAEEVIAASAPELPAPIPAISWPPQPAPAMVNASAVNGAAKTSPRVEPVVEPIPAAQIATRRTAPSIEPIQQSAELHPDLHDLATQPFDEALLGLKTPG